MNFSGSKLAQNSIKDQFGPRCGISAPLKSLMSGYSPETDNQADLGFDTQYQFIFSGSRADQGTSADLKSLSAYGAPRAFIGNIGAFSFQEARAYGGGLAKQTD